MKKRFLAVVVALTLLCGLVPTVYAEEDSESAEETVAEDSSDPAESEEAEPSEDNPLALSAKAAVLMNMETGQIVYSFNSQEQLPEASITKVMTMLLIFEAIDAGKISLDDVVTCSEYAASMGGSQIWLEPGEQMTVDELIKAALVGSANDACVALGEHLAGSNEAFVSMMNQRAEELDMVNTFYVNCTGLDAEGHLTSAQDIAIVSAELLKHEAVLNYTTIWMDTLRNGELQLTNTNKLLKQYSDTIGLKTGTTSQAGCCISAAARRDGMTMIAVVLGAPDSKSRFSDATKLLDYGFANWELVDVSQLSVELEDVSVVNGMEKTVGAYVNMSGNVLVEKGKADEISVSVEMADSLEAPVEVNQCIGSVTLILDGVALESYDIYADRKSDKITLGSAFKELIKGIIDM